MSPPKKITLRDIAAAAGVAESTVSRAFTGQAPIAEDTRERILSAARKLNYLPRRRVTKKSSTERKGVVGVIVAALHNSFFPYLVDRIHDELDALGYDMILIIDELSNSSSSRKIQALIDTALDGVIFTTATIGSPAVDLLVERDIPTVLAIRSNKRRNVDVVESDNKMAGSEAMHHLLELGHTEIACILGPKDTSTTTDRFAGATKVLNDAGIQISPQRIIWSEFTHEGGYSGLVQLLDTLTPPTALFCGNDVIAIGALDACQKLGIDIPKSLSIIGVDNIAMASWSMISLTTVQQSISEIAVLAARRIAARIAGSQSGAPTHDILPTSIVRRRTTAAVFSDQR